MKKILVLIISIIAILSGCGNSSKDEWNSGVETSGTERNSIVTMRANNKEYTLSFNLPEDISQYIDFKIEPIEGTVGGGTSATINFEKDDKTTVLGTFKLYNIGDYDNIKSQEESVDNVVIRNEDEGMNVVLTYKAMDSIPFEEGTEEYKLIENYSLAIGDILSSVILE